MDRASAERWMREALEEAHHQGVVHRDIKPGNIMVGDEIKLMDFGIARMVGASQHTATGAVLGTAMYMSPEQAEAKEVDQRSDIYSLGIILYEMATGRVPFEGTRP
jgi:serine/threonine-protein kinase